MNFYFVRHGQSVANTRHIIANRDQPYPLTEVGRQQAHDLADRLKDIPFTALYTSPIPRAQETAAILAEQLGLISHLSPGLCEIDMGELEDQRSPTAWQKHDKVYGAWIENHEYEQRSPGGESFLDAQARFITFIRALQTQYAYTDNLLLVGHGGIYLSMLPVVLTNLTCEYAWSHPLSNTGLIIATAQKSGSLVCLSWEGEEFPY